MWRNSIALAIVVKYKPVWQHLATKTVSTRMSSARLSREAFQRKSRKGTSGGVVPSEFVDRNNLRVELKMTSF